MTRNTVTDGPSMWHLMLATFDEHPASGGTRSIGIALKNGHRFTVTLDGLDLADPKASGEERGLWTLRGSTTTLPTGYYYLERGSLVVRYNPHTRQGYVDLELMCPDCGHTTLQDDDSRDKQVRICASCKQDVMRQHTVTNCWEWVNTESIRRHETYGDSLKVRDLSDDYTDG